MASGGSSKKIIKKTEEMMSPVYNQAGDICMAVAVVGVIEAIYSLMQFAQERQKEMRKAERRQRKVKEISEQNREVTIKGFTIMKPKDQEKLIEILSKHPVVGVVEVYPS